MREPQLRTCRIIKGSAKRAKIPGFFAIPERVRAYDGEHVDDGQVIFT
ncbi:hypothetical protein [Rhodocaloribacter sp.]